MSRAVDTFAGPGGWDEDAPEGLEIVGVELDPSAVATREAAGHETVQADVSLMDPLDVGPVVGVIGSPPCPTFSAAGGRRGRGLTDVIVGCLRDLAAGKDTRAERREEAFARLQEAGDEKARRDADMSLLVVEPLRWTLALEPEWVALEQVPDVLPIWEVLADILRERGYSVWTGILSAERYGVPQTRKRAILMASRTRKVMPPEPTHQAYVPGEPARGEAGLFGTILPWVSMAEALGWSESDAVGFPRRNDQDDGGEYRERDRRAASEPSFGLTEKARSWDRVQMRANKQANASVRRDDEPAPTIKGGHDSGDRVWVTDNDTSENGGDDDSWVHDRPATAVCGDPRIAPPGYRGGKAEYEAGMVSRAFSPPQPVEQDGLPDQLGLKGEDWPERRPATAVQGDPRIFQPGGHHANDGRRSDPGADGRSQNAIRVTVQEAAVLQGFRPDYPWQGTSTAKFQQVGNAVPPPLAAAILRELV